VKLSALGRYEIRGEIGRGTMGVVYRGYDPVIDREVAVKTILLPDTVPKPQRENYLARFLQEARIAGKLLHTNIVVTYDAATDEKTETPFITMELVEGESLATTVARRKRLSWEEAFHLAISMAEALDYAHQSGIIHRDIKPANVLVNKKGEPKITDFGIAKMPTSDLTQDGVVLGTPYFMSPEQIQGEKLDGRSDLFALGTLLYNLIVGRPPFEAPDVKTVSQLVLYKEPRPPSEVVEGIPEDVDGVLARAMTKSRDDRYPSGRTFAEDLEAVRESRRPMLARVPGERTQAEEKTTAASVPASAETQVRDENPAPGPKETTVEEPPSVLETSVDPPGAKRRSVWLFAILFLIGVAGFVFTVGPDRAKEQAGSWWAWLSDSMGRQVDHVQSAVEETRAEQRRVSAAKARAESLLKRGEAMETRGQWNRARQEYESSLEIFREIKDGGGEASALFARGRLESAVGNWSRARADLDSAASVYRIYERPAGQARALVVLGNLERDLGNPDRADAHYGRASTLAEELPDRRPWLEARFNMAVQDLLHGRWEAAGERLGAVRNDVGAPEYQDIAARVALFLGIHSYADGNFGMATTWWKEARRTFRASGEVGGLAEVALMEGCFDLQRRELESSRQHLAEAERAFRKAEQLPGLAATLECRFELFRDEGDGAERDAVWEELMTVRDSLALPELDMSSRDGGTNELDEDPRFARLKSLLRALPRTALAEERLATFPGVGN
jgi:serine/threonine-protein kinase